MKFLSDMTIWSNLNAFGKNKIVKSAAIWLLIVPLFVKIMPLLKKLGIELSLPFSWVRFYFGALCFSIATFIYILRCPQIIQKFEGYEDYFKSGRGQDYLIKELGLLYKRPFTKAIDQTDLEKFIKDYGDGERKLLLKNENDIQKKLSSIRIKKEQLHEAFWNIRDKAETVEGFSRLVCAALFHVGFGLFIIITFESLISVLRVIFELPTDK
jgi:hypothetical protein